VAKEKKRKKKKKKKTIQYNIQKSFLATQDLDNNDIRNHSNFLNVLS
jgi:hypothetical protein